MLFSFKFVDFWSVRLILFTNKTKNVHGFPTVGNRKRNLWFKFECSYYWAMNNCLEQFPGLLYYLLGKETKQMTEYLTNTYFNYWWNNIIKVISITIWNIFYYFIVIISTSLKNKIENDSAWEDAFYQKEWVKTNSSWVILIFSLYVCCC